jgi:hypothetical protein
MAMCRSIPRAVRFASAGARHTLTTAPHIWSVLPGYAGPDIACLPCTYGGQPDSGTIRSLGKALCLTPVRFELTPFRTGMLLGPQLETLNQRLRPLGHGITSHLKTMDNTRVRIVDTSEI